MICQPFNLSRIAKGVADSALTLGGTQMLWERALFCPNTREDGTPCYDEVSGSHWIECRVCGGSGALYSPPVSFLGIYTDQSNKWIPDGSGGFMQGKKLLSLPRLIRPRILKPREGKSRTQTSKRRLLRDKITILTQCGDVAEVVYPLHDPVSSAINSGIIYWQLEVGNNY